VVQAVALGVERDLVGLGEMTDDLFEVGGCLDPANRG